MKNKIKKDWDSREKSIEELHSDSMEWKSEIRFIEDEIRFFEHLLGSNYINFLDSGLYNKIEGFIHKISIQKKEGKALLKLVEEHELVLSNLIAQDSVTSNKNYLLTHRNLQRELENYSYDYKEIKKQIFKIVENVMREKKTKKLIN